ncbi:50S ribosomal protein L34 [Candidatus Vidania fulgoroideorum]
MKRTYQPSKFKKNKKFGFRSRKKKKIIFKFFKK